MTPAVPIGSKPDEGHLTPDRPEWPRCLIFWCERTEASGGQTPFVDGASVHAEPPGRIRDGFADQGWILRRRFHPGIGVGARGYFKTEGAGEIGRRLAQLGAFDERWDAGVLTGFSARFAAAFDHPVTGHRGWANNVTFSNLLCRSTRSGATANPRFDWQQGDVLVLDNIRCAHGWRTILAPQRVNVGVCGPHRRLKCVHIDV